MDDAKLTLSLVIVLVLVALASASAAGARVSVIVTNTDADPGYVDFDIGTDTPMEPVTLRVFRPGSKRRLLAARTMIAMSVDGGGLASTRLDLYRDLKMGCGVTRTFRATITGWTYPHSPIPFTFEARC